MITPFTSGGRFTIPYGNVSIRSGVPGPPGIGFKLDISGNYDVQNKKIVNIRAPENNEDCATKKYVDENVFNYDMKNNKLINLGEPTFASNGCTKKYCDDYFLYRSSRTTSNYNARNGKIEHVKDPTETHNVATKNYCDNNKFNYDCLNNRLINVLEPENEKDAVNKIWVENLIQESDTVNKKYVDDLIALYKGYVRANKTHIDEQVNEINLKLNKIHPERTKLFVITHVLNEYYTPIKFDKDIIVPSKEKYNIDIYFEGFKDIILSVGSSTHHQTLSQKQDLHYYSTTLEFEGNLFIKAKTSKKTTGTVYLKLEQYFPR